MSANFYLSSHANYHLHPRAAIVAARSEDLKHATEQELGWLEIWSASAIQKICKRLGLRQQVSATAIVYFRRFYLRNAYCETDPTLVAAACCYVAAKAEETPVHVKSAAAEARFVFHEMGLNSFTADNTKLAEMEFYLIEELDFHLIVFHPYRSLVQLCGRDGGLSAGGDFGRLGRSAMLEMDDSALQMAWFVINDTFRSSLCLIHPPHLIAIAAIYLAFSLHPPASARITASRPGSSDGPSSRTRRQSLDTSPSHQGPLARTGPLPPGGHTDPVTFLSTLNIDHSLVLEIVQEIISLYELWNALDTATSASTAASSSSGQGAGTNAGTSTGSNSTQQKSDGSGGVSGTGKNDVTTSSSSLSSSSATITASGVGKQTTLTADERVVGIMLRMRLDRQREINSERDKGIAGKNAGAVAGSGWKKA